MTTSFDSPLKLPQISANAAEPGSVTPRPARNPPCPSGGGGGG